MKPRARTYEEAEDRIAPAEIEARRGRGAHGEERREVVVDTDVETDVAPRTAPAFVTVK